MSNNWGKPAAVQKVPSPPDPRVKNKIALGIARKTHVSFSMEIFEAVIARIENGESVSNICKDDDMPSRVNFHAWLSHNEVLRSMYEDAVLMRAEKHFDEMLEISDDAKAGRDKVTVSHAKLKIDTRKWVLSRLFPQKFGDRTTTDSSVKIETKPQELTEEQLLEALKEKGISLDFLTNS
jgi:hypothetical protein